MDFFTTPDNRLDMSLITKLTRLGNTDEFKEWAALWREVQIIKWERLKDSTE